MVQIKEKKEEVQKKRLRTKECNFCYIPIKDTETYQEHNQNVCDRGKKKRKMMHYQNNSKFQGQDGWNAPVWGSSYPSGPYIMGRKPWNVGPKKVQPTVQSGPAEDEKQGKSD